VLCHYNTHLTQFIANAVEDMGIKRKQKEKDMLDDIFASTVMINKAKEMIGTYCAYCMYCAHCVLYFEVLWTVLYVLGVAACIQQ
jgi:hypothetical protein